MSMSDVTAPTESVFVQAKPYRHTWFKSTCDGRVQPVDEDDSYCNFCDKCERPLQQGQFETYCGVCGLVHRRQKHWKMSLEIEAERRQFDHNSEEGSGTLQNEHTTVVEDSAGETTFDGDELDFNVYSLDQYNDGRDGHRGREDDVQKLDRVRRFLKQRVEACAAAAGLTGYDIREVVQLVISINSGAFTYYGSEGEGGGQDPHIVAAIAHVGNKYITDLDDRMESRDEFQSLAAHMGMDRDDVRGAVKQLHKQLHG